MHTLLSTEQAMMDRYVTLKNLETGTMDYCFDRSNFPEDSHPGFYFMKRGGVYDCRILLFGRTTFKERATFVDCRVLDPNVKMGNCRFVKVAVGEDIYYVYYKDVRDVIKNGRFQFHLGRKELIQVNEVALSDYYIYDFWENE